MSGLFQVRLRLQIKRSTVFYADNFEVNHLRKTYGQRTGFVFHQDNAKPHVSFTTRNKLQEFAWDALSHPHDSANITPEIFACFGPLTRKFFANYERVKSYVNQFFVSKPVQFYAE